MDPSLRSETQDGLLEELGLDASFGEIVRVRLFGSIYRKYRVVNGTYYAVSTPPAVIEQLEVARASGNTVRFHYGNPKTGKDACWSNEMTRGVVARAASPIPWPILLLSKDATGGQHLPDYRIVRMSIDGRDVYRHPTYHLPKFEIRQLLVPAFPDMHVELLADGVHMANFPTLEAAKKWIWYVRGESETK